MKRIAAFAFLLALVPAAQAVALTQSAEDTQAILGYALTEDHLHAYLKMVTEENQMRRCDPAFADDMADITEAHSLAEMQARYESHPRVVALFSCPAK